MMPTFPQSSLSFRTAGFPQYGCKAGFPSGAFPDRPRLKPAPGIRRPTFSLRPPEPTRSGWPIIASDVVRTIGSLRAKLGAITLLQRSFWDFGADYRTLALPSYGVAI